MAATRHLRAETFDLPSPPRPPGQPSPVSVWREPNVRWRPDSAFNLFCCLLFISIFPPHALAHTSYTLRLLTRPAGHPAGAAPGCDAIWVSFWQWLFLLYTSSADEAYWAPCRRRSGLRRLLGALNIWVEYARNYSSSSDISRYLDFCGIKGFLKIRSKYFKTSNLLYFQSYFQI